MRDVSRLADVSLTTVSDYLAGRTNACTPETGKRIDAATKQLNYTHNSLVHGLRFGKTNCIGACVINRAEFPPENKNEFAIRLWRGIEAVANERNLLLLQYPLSIRNGSDIRPFLDGRIDGLVMSAEANDPRSRELALAGMPSVFIDMEEDVPGNYGVVFAREEDTANLALSHLWNAGHRRIAHIAALSYAMTEAHQSGIAIRRMKSYTAWMSSRNEYDPAYLVRADDWNGSGIEAAIDSLFSLPEPPTAIFCANDPIARKAINRLEARGLSVPKDVSIVGVDNSENQSPHKLTTVDVPIEAIGEMAMRTLLRLLEGVSIEECRVSIPVTDLIIGDTVAPPK